MDRVGHRRRLQKFVTGSARHLRCLAPDPQRKSTLCQENGVEYIELPIAFDALTVAVNIKNTWCDTMTVAELKKLWEPEAEGKITQWNQIRDEWPDEKIDAVRPGTIRARSSTSPKSIVEQKNKSRSDYTASEDDNVIVLGVEGEQVCPGLPSLCLLRAPRRQDDESRQDRQRQGPPSSPSPADGQRRQRTTRSPGRCSST